MSKPPLSPAFSHLVAQPADALLELIALHRADPRAGKLDLGVGVYRDAAGTTPIMRAVKEAEHRLHASQTTKSYLGAEGDAAFLALLAPIVFGVTMDRESLIGIQTPGGTGALRLAAEVYALARPDARVWLGVPTWPNHAPIFTAAGLRTEGHPFYDTHSGAILFDDMVASMARAAPHDLLLLHGCCHNPTGLQFTAAQWDALASLCLEHGITPLIDLAYQGLGDGWDEDGAGMRHLLTRVPTALVAYSCDKNFGLYRERVGALWLHEREGRFRETAWQNMLVLARSLWSMPPDHGAALVRLILEDAALMDDWRGELTEMRTRLNAIRALVAQAHPALASIGRQRGMFGLLPLSFKDVGVLRREHGIYMAGSGRINIAGLTPATIDRFAAAVAPFLPKVLELQHG